MHVRSGFVKNGVYPLDGEVMLAGTVGGNPVQMKKVVRILIKPRAFVTDRLRRSLARGNTHVDETMVAALSRDDIVTCTPVKRQERKQQRCVDNDCLISRDDIIRELGEQEETKMQKEMATSERMPTYLSLLSFVLLHEEERKRAAKNKKQATAHRKLDVAETPKQNDKKLHRASQREAPTLFEAEAPPVATSRHGLCPGSARADEKLVGATACIDSQEFSNLKYTY